MTEKQLLQTLCLIGVTGLPGKLLTSEAKAGLLAMDAAPMLTAPNNGVPGWLTTFVSPTTIKIVTAPTKAEEIFGPVKNGSRGVQTAAFPVLEEVGEVASYGDYSSEGVSDVNPTWPKRDEYGFQTVTQLGDVENVALSLAGINATVAKQDASARTIKRAHNRFWFFGVTGLKNYGILNDPDLPTPIAPSNVGGNVTWEDKGADAIYNDVAVTLYNDLSGRSGGLIDENSELVLAISNKVSGNLNKKTEHGSSVKALLKETFPNLRIVVAPEYSTAAGELVQLIAPNVAAQPTGQLGYTDLMHAHGMVRALSSVQEKKSAGTFGAVIFQPFAIGQMLGI